jgi:hypothetical protein
MPYHTYESSGADGWQASYDDQRQPPHSSLLLGCFDKSPIKSKVYRRRLASWN